MCIFSRALPSLLLGWSNILICLWWLWLVPAEAVISPLMPTPSASSFAWWTWLPSSHWLSACLTFADLVVKVSSSVEKSCLKLTRRNNKTRFGVLEIHQGTLEGTRLKEKTHGGELSLWVCFLLLVWLRSSISIIHICGRLTYKMHSWPFRILAAVKSQERGLFRVIQTA